MRPKTIVKMVLLKKMGDLIGTFVPIDVGLFMYNFFSEKLSIKHTQKVCGVTALLGEANTPQVGFIIICGDSTYVATAK